MPVSRTRRSICLRLRPSAHWQGAPCRGARFWQSATGAIPILPARRASASAPCSWRAGCMCRQTAAARRVLRRSTAGILPNSSPQRRGARLAPCARLCGRGLVVAEQRVDAGLILAGAGNARSFESGLLLARRRRGALPPPLGPLHARGDDAIQRRGDLGDALADQVVEAACRHDRQNRLFRLLRLLFVGEGEKTLGRIEDASGGVLGGRADGGELAQGIHEG